MNDKNDSSKQILVLGEHGTLGIPQQQIPEFLQRFDTNQPLPKKVHELLVGYIFAQFLEEKLRESAIVGFPAAEGWRKFCSENPLTLDWLLNHHHDLVSDTDVDIQIKSGEIPLTKYQITRFVYAPDGNAHRRLAELIIKKCRHQQPDDYLHLVVSIENTPSITEKEIKELLKELSVPFRAIFLIRKASPKPGHFSYVQLYPKFIVGKEIQIPLNV